MNEIERGAFCIEEAAKYLHLSAPKVRQLLRDTQHPIPAFKVGRRYVIPKAALERWLLEESERGGQHGPIV